MSGTCETCRWWWGGYCRRFPPAVVIPGTHTGGTGQTPVTRFPETHRLWWCGEHTPKEPTP